eukprot:m.336835 g.336835  ORF g.336835 m.336835 type:complete len:280 (+) comp27788_c1_seq1:289-1128(+)
MNMFGFDDVDVESGDTSHTTTPPGPRSTVGGAAPTADRPDGEIEHFDYDEAHQKLNNTVLAVFDVATELANEATDIAFTFTVLQSEAPDLFYASIAVLAMSMLIRLAIALRPWFVPQEKFEGAPPIDPAKRRTYWWGVLVSLVEPLSGTEIIHGARKSFDTEEQIAAQVKLEGWTHGAGRAGELSRVKYDATLAEAVTRLRVTSHDGDAGHRGRARAAHRPRVPVPRGRGRGRGHHAVYADAGAHAAAHAPHGGGAGLPAGLLQAHPARPHDPRIHDRR